jgi:hypothetical protein
MLNCVYHPIDPMRLVDNDERDKLLATGVWFDHPTKAKEMREKYEKEALNETTPKPEKQSKAKRKDK